MLSIGKLAVGQARYYLDQAEGRVDVVQSIGDGIEDYYAGGAEARGVWRGRGARELGLGGAVDGRELRRVLAGGDPWSDAPLRDSCSRARVAGFDLTFSAPKSVSLVFGLGDPGVAAAVRRAHDVAVSEALGYVERSAAAVRRGRGGATVHEARGLVAAAFRHRTSRAGDPQLHTHVLVANLGRGPDGRWSALDGRRLYAHARAASFLYHAVLRRELSRGLGVAWGPVRDGIAEVDGVPRQVLRAFSRRRVEIEAALEDRGHSGPRAAEAAALATRRAKTAGEDAGRLVETWRRRGDALGLNAEALARTVGRERPRALEAPVRAAIEAALAGPEGLTSQRASFGRRDVLQQLCECVPAGTPVTVEQLEGIADEFLASDAVVPLLPGRRVEAGDDAFRRRDGRRLPVAGEERRYSTPELLAAEQRIVDRVTGARAARAPQSSSAVEAAIRARPSLSEEQRAMVREVCRADVDIAVVAGRAGTGKTFALSAAREAWEADGRLVRGVAVARRAARELEDGAGIPSTSVAALLAGGPLPNGVMLVVDEAGMIGTRQLAQIVDRVRAAGGKLVLVGDHRQLSEIEAGGAFRGLVQRGAAVELTENRRQRHAWERVALDDLRDGRAERALETYARHGRLVVARDPADARRRLVHDWAARDGLMIAVRRADVAELNRLARETLRAAGRLRGPELTLPGGQFAVGDRVVIRRNDPGSDLSNGDRAVVVGVDPSACAVTLDCRGRRASIGRELLLGQTRHGDPAVAHGYAVTVHVAQGATVDCAYVLADGLSRESAYTALSRGRDANRLYASDGVADREEYAPADGVRRTVLERLAADFARSHAEPLAIDAAEPGPERLEALSRDRALAEDAARSAAEQRRALERSRGRWWPGARRRLELARLDERAAWAAVARLEGREEAARVDERAALAAAARLQRRQEAALRETRPAGQPRSGRARRQEQQMSRDVGIDR